MIKRLILAATLAATPVFAVQPDELLTDPALEAQARDISKGLRCPVCQNENIDDSNAAISRELRLLVRDLLMAKYTETLGDVLEAQGQTALAQRLWSDAAKAVNPTADPLDLDGAYQDEVAAELSALGLDAQAIVTQAHGQFDRDAASAQVVDFIVAKYGEYVLLRPQADGANMVLWVAPAAMLLLALAVGWATIRKRGNAPVDLTDAEKARLEEILKS